jgi:hypothetical protein
MVVVGAVLAVAGIWSVRVGLAAAGGGAAWLLADAFGAATATGLLIAAAGAVLAFVVGLIASRVLFFVMGLVVGCVAGARLFAILDTGESSVLLAVVFVPAVAVVGGVLVERWRERFIGWATAIAGTGLLLSGLGRLAPDSLGFLADPEEGVQQVVASLTWVALAVAARAAQRRWAARRTTVAS